MNELELLRKKIDEIDERVCALLLARFEAVKEIGAIKKEKGLPILNEAREEAVFAKVRGKAEREEEKAALAEIYKTIMGEAKKLER